MPVGRGSMTGRYRIAPILLTTARPGCPMHATTGGSRLRRPPCWRSEGSLVGSGKRRSPGVIDRSVRHHWRTNFVYPSQTDPRRGSAGRCDPHARGMFFIGRLDGPVGSRPVGSPGLGRRAFSGRPVGCGGRPQDRDVRRRRGRRGRHLRRGQGRGTAQRHRYPARLGELRPDDQGLRGQVRHQGRVGPADVASQAEIDAVNNLAGTEPPRTCSTSAPTVALANTDLFAPYKVAAWADIPDDLKEADRPLGQRLRAASCPSAATRAGSRCPRPWPTCSSPSTRARSP